MERAEAEAVLDGDREAAVALLLRVGELIEANRRLEARVAELERRLKAELAELVAAALAGSAFGVGAVAGGIVVASRRPRRSVRYVRMRIGMLHPRALRRSR